MDPSAELEERIATLAEQLEPWPGLRGIRLALASAKTPIERAAILLLAGRRLGVERTPTLTEETAAVSVLCLAKGKVQRTLEADRASRAWSSFSADARSHGAPSHDAPCPVSAIPVRRLAELARPRRCP